MKDEFSTIRARQREFDQKQGEIEQILNLSGMKLDEMEDNQTLQRQELNEVRLNSCEEIHAFTNTIQDEMRNEMTGIKRRHANMHKQVKKIKVIKKRFIFYDR